MANYKRKKPRSQVRCILCTGARTGGNSMAKSCGKNSGEQRRRRVFRDVEKEQKSQLD